VTAASAVRRSYPFSTPASGAFTALRHRGYRIYVTGQSLASTGTWMQTIAQDWLVLRLTNSATAVGITMALQFLPALFLSVHGGLLADRCSKRRLLLGTQTANAVLTAALALMTISGVVRAEHVYAFALLSGLVFVVDAPARQVFVAEVVPPADLRSAIALNAAVFQTTRLVGPALASALIGTVGTGWVFAANAACYAGPIVGLLRLRPADLTPMPRAVREPGALRSAGRYVLRRPRILWTIFLVGVVGTFGLNFPIVLTAMAERTFHGSAGLYGLFNMMLAIGSVCGALLAGSRSSSRLRVIAVAGGLFGLAQALAALAPGRTSFLALLVCMGVANLAFQSMANSAVQLWVEPAMRGRVMGLYLLVFTGGTPIGAPLIGAITNSLGPRVGMALCGLLPLVAAVAVAAIRAWPVGEGVSVRRRGRDCAAGRRAGRTGSRRPAARWPRRAARGVWRPTADRPPAGSPRPARRYGRRGSWT
jgi:MFS family permease